MIDPPPGRDPTAEPSAVALGPEGSGWMRLKTLVLLRWLAVAGQTIAILVAHQSYGIALDLTACLLTVGAAVAVNLALVFAMPETRRLTETEALLTLLLDTVQLGFLLYLTGGLNNPFAFLIVAPVTIAGAALRARATVVMGIVTIAIVTLVDTYHLPLVRRDGTMIEVPRLFEFGFWLAIVIGVVFLGLYTRRVASEFRTMGNALLATQMALAREQKLTDLGGVVAAAAHELGTPLATIKLVSTEMIDDLAEAGEACREIRADAELIRQEADRCRTILHSMGRTGRDDLHLRRLPLSALIRDAAEPHLERGKHLVFALGDVPGSPSRQPMVRRQPELLHGLRNLIQNGVDFARSTVWVDAEWDQTSIRLRVADDGPGYPPHLLGRIGDPFFQPRRDESGPSRGREGLGLGLFIARTLLERTGARLNFSNGADPFLAEEERPERCGAIAEVRWPRAAIETVERSEGATNPLNL
ncbi:MAG: ActS/PrrB/RegB family redox-sensitive histidine kinase [Defluviimonas sp.]|nr:ActS/PrrB/RegB family redox-sensitive histidine kinase [Defluviimonas sp.]